MKSVTVLSDRAVGLLAVVSAIAVANAYYIQPLLVEVGGELSISSGLVGILPGLSQIGLACGWHSCCPSRTSSRRADCS